MTDASVEVVTVRRFRCVHCRRSWASKRNATEHAARCWRNPDVRACPTCSHHTSYRMDDCGGRPGCRCADTPESCDLGLMPEEDGHLRVVAGCASWTESDA